MRLPNKKRKNTHFYFYLAEKSLQTLNYFSWQEVLSQLTHPSCLRGVPTPIKPLFTDHPTLLAKRASNHSPAPRQSLARGQLKIAETADFQGFGMARGACAPSGRAMISYIPAVAAPWKGAQGERPMFCWSWHCS